MTDLEKIKYLLKLVEDAYECGFYAGEESYSMLEATSHSSFEDNWHYSYIKEELEKMR